MRKKTPHNTTQHTSTTTHNNNTQQHNKRCQLTTQPPFQYADSAFFVFSTLLYVRVVFLHVGRMPLSVFFFREMCGRLGNEMSRKRKILVTKRWVQLYKNDGDAHPSPSGTEVHVHIKSSDSFMWLGSQLPAHLSRLTDRTWTCDALRILSSETQSHHSLDDFHRIAVVSVSQLPCDSASCRAEELNLTWL